MIETSPGAHYFGPMYRYVCQRLVGVILTAISLLGAQAAPGGSIQAQDRASLPDTARRVLFLGDSITYGGQYVSFVEAYFVTRYPERQIEFINAGLPSETVSGLSEDGHAGGKFPRPDLHERLARVLEQTKPDLVLACYGMNDAIYLPLSAERFQKYKDGMTWLHQQIIAAGAKIIEVTPPVFDDKKGGHPGYNAVLGTYSEWLLGHRDIGWDVVDLHAPMERFHAERRAQNPEFALAGDGVHPGDLGHWIMAKQILLHLGAKDIASVEDPKLVVSGTINGAEILKLICERQAMMKDAWLTSTRHTRPEMNKGLPLAEAQAKAKETAEKIKSLIHSPSNHS